MRFCYTEALLCAFLLVLGLHCYGQKHVDKSVEFWPQYYVNVPIDSVKWSVVSDYSHRYNDVDTKMIQWIGRVGINYQFNKEWSFSAGYAYSEYFSGSSVRRENRPWQQIQVINEYRKLRFNQRLRLEERFQKDSQGSKYNYRLRYQFMLQMPLMSKQKMYAFIADEPMINFGNQVSGNKFDQNRFQFGVQIKLVDGFYLTPAFQHTYQIQSNKIDFKSLNQWRTGITYKW